jgi:hypothetical protein
MAKIKLLFLFLCTVLSCTGGSGEGTVHGPVSIESCNLEKNDFNLEVDFFTATYHNNSLIIRMQHTGALQSFVDGITIHVRDVKTVSENLGTPLEIDLVPSLEAFLETGPEGAVGSNAGVPLTPHDSPARATLYLNDTCPDSTLAFTDGTGTITFDDIYLPSKKKKISGSFSLEFFDPRTWEAPGEIRDTATMFGEFSFGYSRNPQEQPFL